MVETYVVALDISWVKRFTQFALSVYMITNFILLLWDPIKQSPI